LCSVSRSSVSSSKPDLVWVPPSWMIAAATSITPAITAIAAWRYLTRDSYSSCACVLIAGDMLGGCGRSYLFPAGGAHSCSRAIPRSRPWTQATWCRLTVGAHPRRDVGGIVGLEHPGDPIADGEHEVEDR
jgi:hypothetical protein